MTPRTVPDSGPTRKDLVNAIQRAAQDADIVAGTLIEDVPGMLAAEILKLDTRVSDLCHDVSVLLAVVAPHCLRCARPATLCHAGTYRCDTHAQGEEGKWRDLPAAGAIRRLEAAVKVPT